MRMRTTPRERPFVKLRQPWPGLGQMVDVLVKINGEYCYTTKILKPGQKVVDLVKDTRREFRRAQNQEKPCKPHNVLG